MKKLKYLIFTLFTFIFIIPNVSAYTNQDTYYNITMPSYKIELENKTCGNSNLFDYINYIIEQVDFSTSYYQVFITKRYDVNAGNNPYIMSLIPTSYINSTNHYFSPYARFISGGYPTTQFYFYGSVNRTSQVNFYFNNCSSSLDVYNATWTKNLINKIKTNDSAINNSSLNNNLGLYSMGSSTTGFSYPLSYSSSNTLSNTASYNIFGWYYYSSYDIYYIPQNQLNSSYYYKKVKLLFEEQEFTYEDKFLSYYDYYVKPKKPTFIEYKNSLGTIYNNFSPSNIGNFEISLEFNTEDITALNYNQNIDYMWGCYGRVNNNNYYSYEKFSYCDFEQDLVTGTSGDKSNIRFYNLNIYDSNDNIISDFSRYDKIFVYIDFQYKDSTLNTSIYNFVYDSPYNIYYQDYFSGTIYDNFNDLPSLFKLFISTRKSDYSYFEVKVSSTPITDKYFIYKQQYNINTLNPIGHVQLLGETFQRLQLSRNNSLGYMFYQQITNLNDGITPNSLDFIIFDDVIISLNSFSNNDFYYYDENGNITNGDITINYDNNVSSENYDFTYYFHILNNYIEDLSDRVVNLGDIIQEFYNSQPAYLQSTIYVIFMLVCLYFVYKEIKR